MADLKISQLTGATIPLGGTEEVPLVQSGATKKVSVANLTAGRAIAASSVTVGNGRTQLASTYVADVPGPTGNNTGILFGGNTIFPCDGNGSLTNGVASLGTSSYQWYDIFLANNVNIRTAGKGVNFTANTPAAGMTSQLLNWYEEGTWTPTGNGITLSTASGRYTRIGDTVNLFFEIIFPTTVDTNSAQIGGLPFSAGTSLRNGAAIGFTTDTSGNTLVATNNFIQIYNTTGGLTTNASNSTKQYYGTLTYKV